MPERIDRNPSSNSSVIPRREFLGLGAKLAGAAILSPLEKFGRFEDEASPAELKLSSSKPEILHTHKEEVFAPLSYILPLSLTIKSIGFNNLAIHPTNFMDDGSLELPPGGIFTYNESPITSKKGEFRRGQFISYGAGHCMWKNVAQDAKRIEDIDFGNTATIPLAVDKITGEKIENLEYVFNEFVIADIDEIKNILFPVRPLDRPTKPRLVLQTSLRQNSAGEPAPWLLKTSVFKKARKQISTDINDPSLYLCFLAIADMIE